MQDMIEYLKNKAPIIDKAIQKYLPENITEEYVEWAFGKARYAYDLEAIKGAISKPIWDFLNRGGKRWRPALYLLILEAMGGDPEKLMDFVAVPELAHEGSIMMDDIEDGGEMRRGKPCTHKIFGVDIALNAASIMYFLPLMVFAKNKDKLDKDILLRAYEEYNQELINIHIGQGLDIWWHKGNANPTEEQYLQMCAYKTGTLARLSARLAVILSGGTEEQIAKIGKMAEALGVGFQIQDDILSASGEEFAKKKGFGDDITEGKRTLIVIHALSKATQEDKERLVEILNMHTRDVELIKEALMLLKKYGSVEYAKEHAKRIVKEAWSEAEPLIPKGEAKDKLKAFTDFLINREM